MTSNKDYEAIAKALRGEKPGENWDPNKRVQWDLDCKAIARVFAGDNPKFDTARFLEACGAARPDPRGSKPLEDAGVTP